MTVGPLFFAPAAGGGGGGGGGGNVVSLAHFDGTHGATTTTDEVSGISWHVWASAQISNVQSMFGGTSVRSTVDWGAASINTNQSIVLGSGDFTCEVAFYHEQAFLTRAIIDFRSISQSLAVGFGLETSEGVFRLAANTTQTAGSVSINAWHWAAVTREAGTLRAYLDGTLIHTQTDTRTYTASELYLGRNYTSSSRVNGYFDEFRLTKGLARYTGASYTVPTAPFPNP